MHERPAGATALSIGFIGYGAITLAIVLIGFARSAWDHSTLDAFLASLVAALAIATGANLWRLPPVAPVTLLGWAAALTLFNLRLLLDVEGDARWGTAIGMAAFLVVAASLHRYFKRVCGAGS